jgi:hypothetical protein
LNFLAWYLCKWQEKATQNGASKNKNENRFHFKWESFIGHFSMLVAALFIAGQMFRSPIGAAQLPMQREAGIT